jgi:galactokinase
VLLSEQVRDEPVTVSLDSLAPGSPSGWAAYPAGVAWALRDAGYDVAGASIDIDSNLPAGAGVGSSAALECSVALALCALSGIGLPRRSLAATAKRAENEFVGAPTGIIDQSATLLCQAGHAMLLDCGTLSVTHVPFRPSVAGAATLIADTRVTHALVSGDYSRRRAECEAATRELGVASLGSLTDITVTGRLADPVLRRRARHVISDSARARAIASALTASPAPRPASGSSPAPASASAPAPGPGPAPASGPAAAETYRFIGQLLTEGHVSLRDDFEVSWPEADIAVDAAIGAGAHGAKMIGGGFGGSVLALVPANRLPAVRAALTEAFTRRSWSPPEFLDAVPSAAARRIA